MDAHRNWSRPGAGGAEPKDPESGPEGPAARLFAELAEELEEGRGDPAAFFAAHPAEAGELERLYRGWRAAEALLRVAGEGSLVGSVRRGLEGGREAARVERELGRLAVRGFEERYEVGEVLGRGGMGEVRRVTERVLGRELAMKVLRPVEPGRRARLLLRFLEEAEVIGRLEHPGIVPIHELGLDPGGQVYFTMPLVRGRTLAAILGLAAEAREGWTRARVLEVVLKACDAVAYAHSRGVLHRDLKPANVMVGQFGEVYVMDWGLARSLGGADGGAADGGGAGAGEAGEEGGRGAEEDEALTLAGEVLGTPAYMAPEQAAGDSAALDARCDVYALGAILYELVTGQRPYGERSSVEALALLEREPPAPVEAQARGTSEELCAIVRRAMARAREQRYASVTALAEDLRAFLEGRVVRAHRTGAWVEAQKWVARNRALAGALLGVGLALAGGLVATLVLLWRVEGERKNVLRLSLGRTLEGLIERADALWPAQPERLHEFEAWLEEARALAATLEPDPATGEPGLRQQLAELAAREAEWSEEDRWWHEQLARLVAGIEQLCDPRAGYAADGLGPAGFGILRRRNLAERACREVERDEVRARWEAAAAAVRADPRYGGLELVPQAGLVPLGPDPRSGLQEFAHLLSGDVPRREEGGELFLSGASAIVLVLLPGGKAWIGTQAEDPARPNFSDFLTSNEFPAHERELAPFFVGKHEVTQGQWERCTGGRPSFHRSEPEVDRLPIESVTWLAARGGLVRGGLRLPGEAEWEYACRAGTSSEYPWGSNPLDFGRHANVKDFCASLLDPLTPRLARSSEAAKQGKWPEFSTAIDYLDGDDGQRLVAPLGSYLPNRFGLHDMIGNVWEWCEDVYAPYPGALGTPHEDRAMPVEQRVLRGGAFYRPHLRSAERGHEGSDFAYKGVGVRAARDLDP